MLKHLITKDGISPLAFPGRAHTVVKATSYEHNESGLTTELGKEIIAMVDKRKRKQETIIKELQKIETVKVYGDKESKTALVTWGSTVGVVTEIADELGLKVVQPLYLEPFPCWNIEKALKGVKKIIDIETNSTGQLARLLKCYGFNVNKKILRYDGRPFTIDELKKQICQMTK